MTVKQKYVAPGGGKTFNVIGGDQITIKVGGEVTEGAFTVIETTTPPHAGPPLHVHDREDESFYVLEGVFEFHIGSSSTRAQAGAFVMAPRRIPHRFQNVGETHGKLLIVCQPAGFEKFVEEFATLPPDQPPDMEKMLALGRKYGIDFVAETSE
jgi:quercetin dioxygenase-like cupin family protein